MSLSATASSVRYTLEAPVPVCQLTSSGKMNADPCALKGSSWLELDSVLETFKKSGLNVRLEESQSVSEPGAKGLPTRVLKLFFPGDDQPATITFLVSSGKQSAGALSPSTFEQEGKRFVGTEDFFQALATLHRPLKVSSLTNPKLEFLGVRFEMGSNQQPMSVQSALEQYVLTLMLSLPKAIPIGSDGKPFVVPEMTGPLEGFKSFTFPSGNVSSDAQRPRRLSLKGVSGQYFMLLTPFSGGPSTEVLSLELLERQNGDVLESYSLPPAAVFVRSNKELRNGPKYAVWLVPVNFEKPYQPLDTQNPVLLRSSDVSY